MTIRFLICAVLLAFALMPERGEARVVGVAYLSSGQGDDVVQVRGAKRLNIRPAPRQRAQKIRRARPQLRQRAPNRQVQRRVAPRTTAITGRTAMRAKAAPARKPTAARVAQPRQRLAQIRKALALRKPASAKPKTSAKPAAAPKTKPLTRARLAAVSNSLKSAGNQVRYDNKLTGHRTIAGGVKAYDHVPKQYRQQVKNSFQGEVRAIRLTRPMVVQRRYGGGANESGSPYYTRQSYASRAIAKVRLALPRANKANLKTTHILPKGSIILVGRAAPQQAGKTFGVNAKGGDQQIYVVNPKAAKSLKITGGLRP